MQLQLKCIFWSYEAENQHFKCICKMCACCVHVLVTQRILRPDGYERWHKMWWWQTLLWLTCCVAEQSWFLHLLLSAMVHRVDIVHSAATLPLSHPPSPPPGQESWSRSRSSIWRTWRRSCRMTSGTSFWSVSPRSEGSSSCSTSKT